MPASHDMDLADGRALALSVAWNFLGFALPLGIALVSIPCLVAAMGTARFGLLTLLWAIAGYFSLFDFGLGRALTKMVSERLGTRRTEDIPALMWTAAGLSLLLGLAGGAALGGAASWLTRHVLAVPDALREEALAAFYLIAAVLPLVTSAAALRGVLESYQRFGTTSLVRVLMGFFTFAGPLLVLPFSHGLPLVVAVLALGRAVAWCCYLVACLRVIPRRGRRIFSLALVGQMAKLGGWMTVSNVVSPLLVYLDRFLIGGLVSLAVVAYYTTPFEMVSTLFVIPVALSGVLFPALAGVLAQDAGRATGLLERGTRFIFVAMFPLVLFLVTFAEEGLDLWLGADFAKQAGFVFQWLAAGVLANSLAHPAFAFIQGHGRADLTARLHVFELLLYLPVLWWGLEHHGIHGAAVVWFGRVLLDSLALFVLAGWLTPQSRYPMGRLALQAAAGLGVIAAGGLLEGRWLKTVFVMLAGVAFAVFAWCRLLNAAERGAVLRQGKILLPRMGSS